MIRQYVGARYVPKFASPVEWAPSTSYEALTIVTFNNASYTSKVPVPPTVGNPANNPQYWALTGNYNAQVEQYRQETASYKTQVEQYRQETANYNAQVEQYRKDITNLEANLNKRPIKYYSELNTSLQNAVNICASKYTLFIDEDITVNGTINIPSNSQIISNGHKLTQTNYSATPPLSPNIFESYSKENIFVFGLKFEQNGYGRDNDGEQYTNSMKDYGCGIALANCNNVTIDHCYFEKCGGRSISGGRGAALWISNSTNVLITNNIVYLCLHGIMVDKWVNLTKATNGNITVTNNFIELCKGNGIIFEGTNDSYNINITNNVLHNIYWHFFQTLQAENVVFSSNVCKNDNPLPNPAIALSLGSAWKWEQTTYGTPCAVWNSGAGMINCVISSNILLFNSSITNDSFIITGYSNLEISNNITDGNITIAGQSGIENVDCGTLIITGNKAKILYLTAPQPLHGNYNATTTIIDNNELTDVNIEKNENLIINCVGVNTVTIKNVKKGIVNITASGMINVQYNNINGRLESTGNTVNGIVLIGTNFNGDIINDNETGNLLLLDAESSGSIKLTTRTTKYVNVVSYKYAGIALEFNAPVVNGDTQRGMIWHRNTVGNTGETCLSVFKGDGTQTVLATF